MNSPTEHHLGAALRDLVAEQPFTPDVSAIEHRARQARRRDRITRGGIGVGVVGVAAVAAVAVASAVPSTPSSQAGRTQQVTRVGGSHDAKAGASASAKGSAKGSSTGSATAGQPLVKLADVLVADPKPTGDASLVERSTSSSDGTAVTVWDLYADDGQYFFSRTEAGLPAQVKEDNNQGNGIFAQEVAAATSAASGRDLSADALNMAWAGNPDSAPAWIRAQVKDISKGGLQIDNYVWENSQDALIAGAGNPKVRAGVLRLVSLLPGITVTNRIVNGQPTLTITAGKSELGTVGFDPTNPKIETGDAYQEAITINADTGIPLQIATGPAGKVTGTIRYVVTRVSLADIAAGKF